MCFNPYFTGLPILISATRIFLNCVTKFQSLFYWITYSYGVSNILHGNQVNSFNPYFTGLPILIISSIPPPIIFFLVSILILLDYLFL